METIKEPESWNDLDMDWENPDPMRSCYYLAVLKAVDERRKALAQSWQTPHLNYDVYYRNRFQIPSVRIMKLWCDDILYLLRQQSRYIVSKDQFLNDKTTIYDQSPSLSQRTAPTFTYPVPGNHFPISYAKDFLIWAKKTLDALTVFAYPYVKINYYNPTPEYTNNYMGDSYWQDPAVKNEKDEKKRLEIAASLFIDEHSKDIIIKNVVCQSFDINLQTSIGGETVTVHTIVKLPKSAVVRSFARPKIYCMVKPLPWYEPAQTKNFFCDFGYGVEVNTNKFFDLGQLPEEKDSEIELFPFQLEQMRPYFSAGNGISHKFQARCHFALDYNVEGGFRFRSGV